MLRQLFDMINMKWARDTKLSKAVVIGKGSGTYPYLSVRDGVLTFHPYVYGGYTGGGISFYPYEEGTMVPYQAIDLEGLTLGDVCGTIAAMGYTVDTSEAERLGMMNESALVIVDTTTAQPLEPGVDLYCFTANFWRVLYPLHRLLTKFDGDVDVAIEQLMLPSTRGEWLDYWASFLKIRRLPDEDDTLLLRRVFLTLSSAKSNNIAMEELISYYIGTEARVLDFEASHIEVRVDPLYMDSATKVRDIIALLKGAGVEYFLNYQKGFEESYPAFFRNENGGLTFGEANLGGMTTQVSLPVYEEDYLYIPPELRKSFILGTAKLNGTNRLSSPSTKVVESLGMVMTDSAGNVIQQL